MVTHSGITTTIRNNQIGQIGLLMLTVWIASMPIQKDGEDTLLFYPLYTSMEATTLFTTGTCLIIFSLVAIAQNMLSTAMFQINPQPFKMMIQNSYYLYLSHYCLMLVVLSVLPQKFMKES